MTLWDRIFGRSQPAVSSIVPAKTQHKITTSDGESNKIAQQKLNEGEEYMSEDMISSDNVTKELLKSLFDAAFMEAKIDGDGDLMVKDAVNCWVYPSDNKQYISLVARFGFKDSASALERLQCVNAINYNYYLIRAMVNQENSVLRLDYDIFIGSGISKKHFIQLVKKFCLIPHEAVAKYGANLVN